jgi:2-phosphoglycerate kinase
MPIAGLVPSDCLILIGGGSSLGKTTAAAEIARLYGMQHLQIDAVRAEEPDPAVNFVGSSPEVWDLRPEILRDRLMQMGALLRPHILRLVSTQLASGVPSVIEGEGIEPSLVESLSHQTVRLVFVAEVSEKRLAETLANRPSAGAVRFRQLNAARRRHVCRMNRLYGEWIAAEALSHGLPCLSSQPWSDLAERICDAATRPNRSG